MDQDLQLEIIRRTCEELLACRMAIPPQAMPMQFDPPRATPAHFALEHHHKCVFQNMNTWQWVKKEDLLEDNQKETR